MYTRGKNALFKVSKWHQPTPMAFRDGSERPQAYRPGDDEAGQEEPGAVAG